jgi:hypothetical protein
VVVTDAPAHNGPGGENPYDGTVTAPGWGETVAALNEAGVKVVGAAVSVELPFPLPVPVEVEAMSRPHLEALARDTGSLSVDSALTVYDAPGGNVTDAVVDGVIDLVGATRQDVTARTIDDTSDEVDATRFVRRIQPTRATGAVDFDETTFLGVGGGTTVTFEVTFHNDFLPSESHVQIFRAEIEVQDVPSGTRLDLRNVYIVVPAPRGGRI